jgi:hypothetical protein
MSIETKEKEHWNIAYSNLYDSVIKGKLTTKQYNVFTNIWYKAKDLYPNLRYPAIYLLNDKLILNWSYIDLKGFVLTIDILQDGKIDWFYKSPIEIHGTGENLSEKLDEEFPEKCYKLFEVFCL